MIVGGVFVVGWVKLENDNVYWWKFARAAVVLFGWFVLGG